MMAEGLGTCAKAGWLCAARSRWRLTAGERSSLGTYLAYPFGPAAHIPTRPLNGQETAGGGCQNGRSSPDPPLLSPLRDGGRPPCCCRGFRRALLGAAPPLDVRRPCWQPAPRPSRGNLRAAGPLAQALSCGCGSWEWGCRGVSSYLIAAQIAKEVPSRLLLSSAELLRPPVHLRPELPCHGRLAAVGAGSQQQQRRRCRSAPQVEALPLCTGVARRPDRLHGAGGRPGGRCAQPAGPECAHAAHLPPAPHPPRPPHPTFRFSSKRPSRYAVEVGGDRGVSRGAGVPPHHFKIPGSPASLQGRALGGIAKPFFWARYRSHSSLHRVLRASARYFNKAI